jgi:hypothetical protein
MGAGYQDLDLVFARLDGSICRPCSSPVTFED